MSKPQMSTTSTGPSSDGDFHQTSGDRGTIVQLILASLFYVRRLADMLMTTWQRWGQPPSKIDKGTDMEDALVQWAKTGDLIEYLNHPMVQFAIYLELVEPTDQFSELQPRRRRYLRRMVRPSLRTIFRLILGQASASLLYVCQLADMLMTTWRRRSPKIDKGTNTEDDLVRCTKTESPSELLNHPVLWFAMYLGLVKPLPRYSEFHPRRRRRLRLTVHPPLRALG
ncbi:uncharacterized protein LOC132935924 [Metopolophium dirhodum]|uniref:uncharacterized protein LOC132935924 n=1 Tax=Metopolophium dirhodum TaxID=44670 RepID=UPI00299081ED|nr:uncharacterized protein LOC132935924 [Metopolophium dirhodum]XP_060858556.1 uncharacterized protein LOC132935924 [Metopolophium dirhodum]